MSLSNTTVSKLPPSAPKILVDPLRRLRLDQMNAVERLQAIMFRIQGPSLSALVHGPDNAPDSVSIGELIDDLGRGQTTITTLLNILEEHI